MSVKRLDGRDGLIVRGEKYLEIPKGSIAARPELGTGARTGMIRFNTDTNIYEGFNGTSWVPLVSGSWTIIDPANDPTYASFPGEQILVDTANAPCTIILAETAFEGDSVRVSDTGYALLNNVTVGSYPNNDPLETPLFEYTIDNNNSEVTFVYGTVNGVTTWTKVDLETFIAHGSSKLEIETPGGNAELTGGSLIVQDSDVILNGTDSQLLIANGDINVTVGDINVGTGNISTDSGTISIGTGLEITETKVTVNEVTGLVTASIVDNLDATNKQYVDTADTVLQNSITTNNNQLIKVGNVGSGISYSGTAPSHTIAVDLASTSGLKFSADKLLVDIAGLSSGGVPSASDQLMMEIGGTLVSVTKSDLLSGLGAPRSWLGTVELTDLGNSGTTTDATDATITEAVAPTAGAGAEFTVSNATTVTSTITGASETYDAGDSVVWSGTAWVKLTASSAPDAVTSVFGRTGGIAALSGDYTAQKITFDPSGLVDITTSEVQNALEELDLNKASRDDDNTYTGINTFNGVVDINANTTISGVIDLTGATTINGATVVNNTLQVQSTSNLVGNATLGANASIVGSLTMSSSGSKIIAPQGARTAPSIQLGSGSQTGIWRDEALSYGDVIFSAHGEAVGAFYRNGTTAAGLILKEETTNTVAPTLIIDNNQSDTLPRKADIYITNFSPLISMLDKDATNQVTIEARSETFIVNNRDSSQNIINRLLEVDTARTLLVSQLQGIQGTASEPGISFVDVDDTGLTSTIGVGSDSNQLGLVAGGAQLVTIRNDDTNSAVKFEGTGSITLPSGDTASRTVGVPGALRFNTELNQFEGFDGTSWDDIAYTNLNIIEWFIRNDDVTVTSNVGYLIDTSTKEITVTLPPGNINDFIWIADYFGTSSANVINVIGTGDPLNPTDPIMGSYEALTINSANAVVQLTYIDGNSPGSVGWKITSGLGEFGGSDAITWQDPLTSSFNAQAFLSYMVDSTISPVTVTLPTAPDVSTYIRVADWAGTAAINNLIVSSGSNINGASDDFIIRTANAALTFTYIDATQGWKITAGSGTGGGSGISNWEFIDASTETSPITLGSSLAYMIDTTSDPITTLLPVAPNQFDIIHIMDHKGTCSINPITIDANGKLLVGSTDDIVMDLDRSMVQLTYMGDADDQGWVVTNGIGEGGGGGASKDDWQVVTSNTTAVIGGGYMCNTSANPILITLPPSPVINNKVKISDYVGTANANNISISSSDLIMGLSDTLVIDQNYATVELTYIDNVVGWKITDGIGEGGSGSGLNTITETVVLTNPATTDITFTQVSALTSAIYVNGVRLVPGYEYVAISESTIRLSVTFPSSSILYAVQGDADVVPGDIWNFITIEERKTIGSGVSSVQFENIQTDIASFSVYVNGVRLDGTEYTPSGVDSISLTNTYPSGSVVVGVQNEPTNTATQIASSQSSYEYSPLKLGNYTFWVNSNKLYMKDGTPTSATDGTIVGTQF